MKRGRGRREGPLGSKVTFLAGFALASLAVTAAINAVFWQNGRHPAPIAETRGLMSPFLTGTARPVRSDTVEIAPQQASVSVEELSPDERRRLISDLQTVLSERKLYTGAIDGLHGPLTERAIKAFQREAGLPVTGEPTSELLDRIKYQTMLTALENTGSPPVPVPKPKPKRLRSSAEAAEPQTTQTDASSGASGEPSPEATQDYAGEADFRRLLKTIEHSADEHPARTATLDQGSTNATPASSPPEKLGAEPQIEVQLVQRGLSELGYSPGAVDGVLGEATRNAIREFEADRGLPVTGGVSASVIKELRKVTGISTLTSG